MSHARITIACACTILLASSFLAFANNKTIETESVIEEIQTDDQVINYDSTYTYEVTTEEKENKNNNSEKETVDTTEENLTETIEETKEEVNEEITEQIVQEVIEEEQKYISKYVPSNNSFKSYMSYKAITMKSSPQYKLQQTAYTDMYGLRMADGRYCIALGTYYTSTIGTKVDVVMANGSILKCIVGDLKANRHTDSQNIRAQDGSVVEFIIDKNSLHPMARRMGNISYAAEKFSGEIIEIRVYQN